MLDAGGQYCHLIARKVRDLGVYAEVRASETPAAELATARGIIISGGPSSVYDPDSPTLGLTAWEHAALGAIYDSASPAAELLAERGALPYRHCPAVPDYWSEIPEDAAPYGRVLVPAGASESMSDGGVHGIATLAAAADRDGVDVRTGHRV